MTKKHTRPGKLARLRMTAWALVIVSIAVGPLSAQTRDKKKPAASAPAEAAPAEAGSKSEKVVTTQQQRAIYLLEQLLDKSRDFDNEGLKIRIRARVADSLWDFDPARARQMFEDAFRAIDAPAATAQAGEKAAPATALPKPQLRNEIIRLISARDSELADKLIKTVTDETRQQEAGPFDITMNNRALLYLQSAMLLVNSDLKRASHMLKMSMDAGLFGEQLPNALNAFRRKDSALADDLFKYALHKPAGSSQSPSLKVIFLGEYVFPDSAAAGGPNASTQAAPPNLELVAEFLNFAYAAFMQNDNQAQPVSSDQKTDVHSQIDYWALQSLLPYFDQYMPEKGLALRAQMKRTASKIPGDQMELIDSFTHPNVVQDLLDRALRASGPEKDDLYAQAALMAMQKGDIEQSLSIVKNIGDAQMKSGVETAARLQGVTESIGKEDYDAAYRYAKDVPRLQQRIFAFSQLSSALFDKKDRPRALEVLADAEALTNKAESGPDKARAMLTLAGAVARIDAIRGIEVMKSAIDAINRTSLTLTPGGILTIGGRGAGPLNVFNFNDAFTPLAHSDFEGALLLARSLERKEAAALAQLAICRAALIKSAGDNKGREEKAAQQPAPGKDDEPAGKDKEPASQDKAPADKDKTPAGKDKKKPARPESEP